MRVLNIRRKAVNMMILVIIVTTLAMILAATTIMYWMIWEPGNRH